VRRLPKQRDDDEPRGDKQPEEAQLEFLQQKLLPVYVRPHSDPIILSQNAEHLDHLTHDDNALPFDHAQTNQAILALFQASHPGQTQPVIETFIGILKQIEANLQIDQE
jgi:hypothetical protein